MKKLFAVCIAMLAALSLLAAQNDATGKDLAQFPELSGPYLGQKPPGKTPLPFAINIAALHQELHGIVVFTPDGKEAYWKPAWNPQTAIWSSRVVDGTWTRPAIAPFSAENQGDDVPFVSADGQKLFFLSKRPLADAGQSSEQKIWLMERRAGVWSAPRPLPAEINSMAGIHWQLSTDRQGNLYFSTAKFVTGHIEGAIYCSLFSGGQYQPPVKLPAAINSGLYNFSPYIAPDGSYLLFSRQFADRGYQNFISFKKGDGSWSEAQNLKEKMGFEYGLNPYVSADGKYFFCVTTKGQNVPYWADAGFIAELKKIAK